MVLKTQSLFEVIKPPAGHIQLHAAVQGDPVSTPEPRLHFIDMVEVDDRRAVYALK